MRRKKRTRIRRRRRRGRCGGGRSRGGGRRGGGGGGGCILDFEPIFCRVNSALESYKCRQFIGNSTGCPTYRSRSNINWCTRKFHSTFTVPPDAPERRAISRCHIAVPLRNSTNDPCRRTGRRTSQSSPTAAFQLKWLLRYSLSKNELKKRFCKQPHYEHCYFIIRGAVWPHPPPKLQRSSGRIISMSTSAVRYLAKSFHKVWARMEPKSSRYLSGIMIEAFIGVEIPSWSTGHKLLDFMLYSKQNIPHRGNVLNLNIIKQIIRRFIAYSSSSYVTPSVTSKENCRSRGRATPRLDPVGVPPAPLAASGCITITQYLTTRARTLP
ncbi:unnamed protein product [Nesidiocoris tenuis]|uniref:Uncharacterized protein n=1 Tax=Nesidiocoris tenuis TaxID=355587 RepID=A0A6H5HRH1_9HEMI|nr:unnamed protein product [Nesidiocoris tenuis]